LGNVWEDWGCCAWDQSSGQYCLGYDDESAQLSDSKGNDRAGDTPEELLFEVLGWQVPFNALKYWLRAVPQPEYAYEYKLNTETQSLSELRQRGWHLHFSKYSLDLSNEKKAPRKIVAKNNLLVDGEEVEVTIRFIVRSLTGWKIKFRKIKL